MFVKWQERKNKKKYFSLLSCMMFYYHSHLHHSSEEIAVEMCFDFICQFRCHFERQIFTHKAQVKITLLENFRDEKFIGVVLRESSLAQSLLEPFQALASVDSLST